MDYKILGFDLFTVLNTASLSYFWYIVLKRCILDELISIIKDGTTNG